MRLIHSILTGAAVAGLATGAGAQEKKAAPKKELSKTLLDGPERCVTEDGKIVCSTFRRADFDSAMMKRAALGIQLSSTGSLRDTLGVFVARVTPKGPAESAGIFEGDRIVSINGVDLRVNPADAGDSYASGLPSRRLTREVGKLSPGNVATLRVFTGGRIRDVRVTAGRASDLRDGGAFGYFFDGSHPGFIMGEMPNWERMRVPFQRLRELEGMKVPLERLRQDLPRLHLEEGERMRLLEKLDGARMRIEGMPRLRDGTNVRVLTPSRIRRMEPEVIYLDSDGDVILDSSKKVKEEKAKAEKRKKTQR